MRIRCWIFCNVWTPFINGRWHMLTSRKEPSVWEADWDPSIFFGNWHPGCSGKLKGQHFSSLVGSQYGKKKSLGNTSGHFLQKIRYVQGAFGRVRVHDLSKLVRSQYGKLEVEDENLLRVWITRDVLLRMLMIHYGPFRSRNDPIGLSIFMDRDLCSWTLTCFRMWHVGALWNAIWELLGAIWTFF